MSHFADHFSGHADAYAQFRPRYPDALFQALAVLAPRRRLAWDCATGNGQAAIALAAHFDAVLATDASTAQIAAATPHPRVSYAVAPAERVEGLADASVDLIAVAQALHWFDHARFYAEARRVLAPGGVIAAWCYGLMFVNPEVDAVIGRIYAETGPDWPPERALLEAGYRTLDWPFDELEPIAVAMEADWSLAALVGYLGTWSGVVRFRQRAGHCALAEAVPDLQRAWGDAPTRRVRWPVALRVGRVAG